MLDHNFNDIKEVAKEFNNLYKKFPNLIIDGGRDLEEELGINYSNQSFSDIYSQSSYDKPISNSNFSFTSNSISKEGDKEEIRKKIKIDQENDNLISQEEINNIQEAEKKQQKSL